MVGSCDGIIIVWCWSILANLWSWELISISHYPMCQLVNHLKGLFPTILKKCDKLLDYSLGQIFLHIIYIVYMLCASTQSKFIISSKLIACKSNRFQSLNFVFVLGPDRDQFLGLFVFRILKFVVDYYRVMCRFKKNTKNEDKLILQRTKFALLEFPEAEVIVKKLLKAILNKKTRQMIVYQDYN